MTDKPDYYLNLPSMSGHDWLSTQDSFDLGWISGLFKVADKSINGLFSGFNLQINEEDLLDLEFDIDKFKDDGLTPFIYVIVWLALAVIFTLAGLIWFCCNKCCCCCRSSFKGRGKKDGDEFDFDNLENTDPHFNLGPTYSKRKQKKFSKPSSGAIIIAVLMTIWLISLLLMLLHTFGANEKTKQGIDRIQPDLQNALADIISYVAKTAEQLKYAFIDSYSVLDENVRQISDSCTEPGCEVIHRVVNDALGQTNESLTRDLKSLTDALDDIEETSRETKEEMDKYEDILKDTNTGLYWFFMLFNLIYLAVFCLILVGTVLAIFAAQRGLKLTGYILMRMAIVLIFLSGIFVVAQLILFFTVGGTVSEVICPAIRGLETEPNTPLEIALNRLQKHQRNQTARQGGGGGEGDYDMPNVGEILRSCKNNETAYKAFNLVTAFDINVLNELIDRFDFPEIPGPPQDSARQIREQVKFYSDFVVDAVGTKIGQCHPAYAALNSTLDLFCYKVSAPVISFWFILQFIAAGFLLMVITVLVFERLHF